MTITLTVGAATLALDPDLLWSDEFDWSPVEQTAEYGTLGALLIDVAPVLGGRPITLQPEGDDSAWLSRLDVEQLQAWAAIPGLVLTLVLRGIARQVRWRHQDKPALAARPVVHYSDVEAGDAYLATLKFMEI